MMTYSLTSLIFPDYWIFDHKKIQNNWKVSATQTAQAKSNTLCLCRFSHVCHVLILLTPLLILFQSLYKTIELWHSKIQLTVMDRIDDTLIDELRTRC